MVFLLQRFEVIPRREVELGYGPGGPPVLRNNKVLELLRRLKDIGCLGAEEI